VRHLRTALAVAVLAGGFSLLGFANPDCAYACSCIQPKPIAEYANEPDTVILAGTVTAMDPQARLGSFKVERWYKGTSENAEVIVRSGDGADCGIPLSVGQHLVMVAYVEEQTLNPSICSPWGDLSLPEGQQLQADTVAAFGEGTAPGGAEAPGEDSAAFDVPGLLLVGGAVILGIIVIIAGASFVSARRGS
jgi:hypothetical protein